MRPLLRVAKLRRTTYALLPVVAATTATVFWFIMHPSEPSYKGRRLSDWVNLYGNHPAFRYPATKREPAEAIRHIGTNAVPWLLAWIAYEQPPWRQKAAALALPQWLAQSRPVRALRSDRRYVRAQNATQAFEVLGPMATPALPELTRRISLTNSSDGRDRSLAALSDLGSLAVPTMAKVLSNPADSGRMWVMFCVEALGTNALPLLPILLRNLQHPNIGVATANAYALGALALDPDLVVPALVACLKDPRPDLRTCAASALARFGGLARPALPALTNTLSDPDDCVRTNAAEAIAAILPPCDHTTCLKPPSARQCLKTHP